MITYLPRAATIPPIRALPSPFPLTGTPRAPASVPSRWLPSVLPLSATSTSPLIPLSARNPLALRTYVATVSASLRQGMTTVSSTFRLLHRQWIRLDGRGLVARRITVGGGTNAPNWPFVDCRVHRPSTGGYGLRVMPAATSREPSARRGWSFRPKRFGRAPWATPAGRRHPCAR